MQPHLPPSTPLPNSSNQHLPPPVPVTPISPLWFPSMQVAKQDPCETPTVSADLNVLQLPAKWQMPTHPLKLPELPVLTSPILSSPATFGPSPQQRQWGCFPSPGNANSDRQSDRTKTAVDQSASTEDPRRNQKVAASRELDEDVKNKNLVKLVPSSNPEVITIDDSDGEDAIFPLPQESRPELTVSAGIQTER